MVLVLADWLAVLVLTDRLLAGWLARVRQGTLNQLLPAPSSTTIKRKHREEMLDWPVRAFLGARHGYGGGGVE